MPTDSKYLAVPGSVNTRSLSEAVREPHAAERDAEQEGAPFAGRSESRRGERSGDHVGPKKWKDVLNAMFLFAIIAFATICRRIFDVKR